MAGERGPLDDPKILCATVHIAYHILNSVAREAENHKDIPDRVLNLVVIAAFAASAHKLELAIPGFMKALGKMLLNPPDGLKNPEIIKEDEPDVRH